jgi:hypothetical protein
MSVLKNENIKKSRMDDIIVGAIHELPKKSIQKFTNIFVGANCHTPFHFRHCERSEAISIEVKSDK